MTQTPEERARQVWKKITGSYPDVDPIKAIATALRVARNAALEEAAGVAQWFEDNGRDDYSAGRDWAAQGIRDRILALKDTTGGE